MNADKQENIVDTETNEKEQKKTEKTNKQPQEAKPKFVRQEYEPKESDYYGFGTY